MITRDELAAAKGAAARREAAREAWAAGIDLLDIADALGVGAQTAWRMIRGSK